MRFDAKQWCTCCPVAFVALLGVVAGIPACNDENVALNEAEATRMLGASPLHYAALTNDVEKIKSLLAGGSMDINAKDSEAEETPLHYAARAGSLAASEALVANGADIHAKDKSGQLAFHLAVEAIGDEIAKLLLDKGTDVDVVDGGGRTALHRAANRGSMSTVTLLLDRGADPNASFRRGTPMHLAAFMNHKAVVELLLARGADVNGNVDPASGQTPYDRALAHGHHKMVDFLRTQGGRAGTRRPRGAGGRRLDFARLDANKDGKVTADEFQGPPQFFERLDANKDGAITEEEIAAMRASRGGRS